MNSARYSWRSWLRDVGASWNRFWFAPSAPHTLALIRILAGAMLLYTHAVWTLGLTDFLGPHSWITVATARQELRELHAYTWSFFWYVTSPALLYVIHAIALAVFAMLMLGYKTRVVSILACALTLSYCHRLNGALFGLDQINALLAIYLMVGDSGAAYSLDRWLAQRKGRAPLEVASNVWTNVAIRLIQCHMCVIYLFGGLAKIRGDSWWIGDAFWYSIANYEYQSLDMTWLAASPALIALMTHLTVFWETFYCVLIWPRVTRPVMLVLAVFVHGGIILFLGMPTFGLAMLIGNLAFVSPEFVKGLLSRWKPRAKHSVEKVEEPSNAKKPLKRRSAELSSRV